MSDRFFNAYVYNDRGYHHGAARILSDPKNVASFLVRNLPAPKIVIATPFDNLVLTVKDGIITECAMPDYLDYRLLPVLMPMLYGAIEVEEIQYDSDEHQTGDESVNSVGALNELANQYGYISMEDGKFHEPSKPNTEKENDE